MKRMLSPIEIISQTRKLSLNTNFIQNSI